MFGVSLGSGSTGEAINPRGYCSRFCIRPNRCRVPLRWPLVVRTYLSSPHRRHARRDIALDLRIPPSVSITITTHPSPRAITITITIGAWCQHQQLV